MGEVTLRGVEDGDLDGLFEQMRDPEGVWMAAFTAKNPDDRVYFDAHMAKVRAAPEVTARTVLLDGRAVGHVASFPGEDVGGREVTYVVDRSVWGQGVASRALALLLEVDTGRPLYARAASDNLASLRVLEKAGFRRIGTERAFAQARQAEIEESVLRLD